ncbi:MAG: alpha/beta hydrolase [Acidimicrobiaceae bacterium]|nr:alpha/beta hydrolase [Acidimicrobiaceae bacterium]
MGMNGRTGRFLGLDFSAAATADGEWTTYYDEGQGTPVVFIHGSGLGVSAAANWSLTLPAFAPRYRTIAMDLAGFGRTMPGPSTAYGIRGWVDQIVRLLDHLEVERTWLVGNSLGGWVALRMVLSYPDRVEGLIGMGTGGGPRSTGSPLPALNTEDGAARMRSVLERFVTDPSLITDELVGERVDVATSPGAHERVTTAITARDRDRENDPLTSEELRSIDQPVLLVHGRNDAVIPPARSVSLADDLTNCDLLILSNCGHWSQIERRQLFESAVMAFIESNGRGASA